MPAVREIAGCLDALAARLREQYPDMGREVAIDTQPILARRIATLRVAQRPLVSRGEQRAYRSEMR